MNHRWHQHKQRRKDAGYTLIELVVASASATILVGGLASSLYIAAQSLDVGSGSLVENRIARSALAELNRDLHSALTLSELTATSVTMSVPSRDGDTVPETIRYAWSGVTGDPLTQQYNGGTAIEFAPNVQSFSLNWLTRMMEGVSSRPIIMLISGEASIDSDGAATPSSTEQARLDLMDGWGFDTTTISQSATQTQIDAALANANVVYISGEANAATIGTKLNAATVGIVTESYANAEQLDFYSSSSVYTASNNTINIQNNSHYITNLHSTGVLTVTTSGTSMNGNLATPAPDLVTLANFSAGFAYPSLVLLDAGDELAGGGAAAGRRCQLPWGESSFNPSILNADGQLIMKRAIEWAAGAGDDTETAAGLAYHEFTETAVSSNSTSITIAVPPGYAEGDLLVAAVATDGDESADLTPPTGWTSVVVADGSGSTTLGVWWKLATASESSSYEFTWSGSEKSYGWIMRFSGQDPSTPINVSATAEGASSSPTAPAATTTVDGCMIVRLGGFDDDDVTIDDTGIAGATTITMDESGTGSTSCSGGATYAVQATAGDSGSASFALTASEQFRTVTIAIAPDPSP